MDNTGLVAGSRKERLEFPNATTRQKRWATSESSSAPTIITRWVIWSGKTYNLEPGSPSEGKTERERLRLPVMAPFNQPSTVFV